MAILELSVRRTPPKSKQVSSREAALEEALKLQHSWWDNAPKVAEPGLNKAP